jgi:putative ABC transport system permease protein
MVSQHPEAYPHGENFQISAVRLRDQITSRAKTVLLVLLAASVLVFVIACSNAANLILARTVRREGELSIRAALGASTSSLRRTLLIDSLLLCGTGAALGVLIARPMVAVLARYASRFSIRALDLTVDSSMLWVGALLAVVAAVLLAFVPRLPSAESANGLSSGGVRITGSTGRRLRVFAVTQIAACFMLLAGAGMLLKTLLALQSVRPGFDTHNVLAINVPVVSYGRTPDQILDFYKETIRQVSTLPGVDRVAVGTAVPWRDKGIFGPGFQFTAQGHVRANGEEDPHAQFRTISPGFFAALGVPIIEGRDFNDLDRKDSEKVVIISQSAAIKMFPNTDALNQHIMWTDPVMKFIDVSPEPRRIVGISADMDDENVVPGAMLTVYHPLDQEFGGGRLFVHTHSDPYALVTPITRIIRDLSVDQPVEKAATLDDVRAEVLTPDRLNALVFGGFAAVALAIAVIGVAGVLVFSVSGRTREFGIRLALGAQPRSLLTSVIAQGALMAAVGIVAGAVFGYLLARLANSYVVDMRMPDLVPVVASAAVLLSAAVVASVLPAARAARIDVMDALRSE